MKEILVLSGKGGTGKTTIASALAVAAGKEAVIADYDVDAANMHLMLKPDIAVSDDFYGGQVAFINSDECLGCGSCSSVCRFDAVTKSGDIYKIRSLDCEGCGYCARVCPSQALVMLPHWSGHVFVSSIRTGSTMVHARLGIGAENSGKLVAEVKKRATNIAEKEGKKYLIADGSPGIGCPVISSLSGASYVIIVTEPTLSALEDMKRLLEVIRSFRIKTGCVINKFNINPQRTTELLKFLHQNDIEHLANIPYDRNVISFMTKSLTIAESSDEMKEKIQLILKKIKNKII